MGQLSELNHTYSTQILSQKYWRHDQGVLNPVITPCSILSNPCTVTTKSTLEPYLIAHLACFHETSFAPFVWRSDPQSVYLLKKRQTYIVVIYISIYHIRFEISILSVCFVLCNYLLNILITKDNKFKFRPPLSWTMYLAVAESQPRSEH